jgi:hypothetical protein
MRTHRLTFPRIIASAHSVVLRGRLHPCSPPRGRLVLGGRKGPGLLPGAPPHNLRKDYATAMQRGLGPKHGAVRPARGCTGGGRGVALPARAVKAWPRIRQALCDPRSGWVYADAALSLKRRIWDTLQTNPAQNALACTRLRWSPPAASTPRAVRFPDP